MCFKETIKPEFWTYTLRKSLQIMSGCMVTDFVSLIWNLKTVL
ncbi:hypothetical protein BM48_1732 [Streptococcus pneumoniae]|nr:hypothetical protein BM48_1732 [Streptococcus pneumoniae]